MCAEAKAGPPPAGRILVLNNYSLERVGREVAEEGKPAHHLYGADLLAAHGHRVEIIPCIERTRSRLLRRLLFLVPPLGDVSQQWLAWKACQRGDVIYAPCQTQTQLLSYFRALGLFRAPIVTLAHHPLQRGRLLRWRRPFLKLQLAGTDAFPSLSRGVADELDQLKGRPGWSQPVHWGPDLPAYPRPSGESGNGAFSAGRTGRDFATLAAAAVQARVKVNIYCLRDAWRDEFAATAPWADFTVVQQESDLGYRALLPKLASARVHAIPLDPGTSLAGLTSLTDALALGKPVIMTRHRLIDVDIEGEGIGRWVEPRDVEGWAKALAWFDAHPAEAAAMGRRARALAENRWNYLQFVREISGILSRVTGDGRRQGS